MKLFIAEKPSLAQAIAKGLPGPIQRKDGYIQTGDGMVSWCFGHLLGTANPDAYDPKYEGFPGKFEDLPVIPQNWKQVVSEGKSKQVGIIKALLKTCTSVVNAGDPGREGQLIVDELLEFLNNKKPVLRIQLNAVDPATVKKELANLQDNKLFLSLYHAGLGRQRADWLVGMNLSRAYSILGSKEGYRGVLSVGRVQSPTLAIVVNRDREIDAFVPKDYWTIKAQFRADDKGKPVDFWMNWLAPGVSTALKIEDAKDDEDDEDEDDLAAASSGQNRPVWLDEQNRIIDQSVAQSIIQKIKGQEGVVTDAVRRRVQESAPLPYSLSDMQALGNSRWGLSVTETLEVCQSLYDKGFASYPRTDCRYLPELQFPDALNVIASIGKAVPHLTGFANQANPALKSKAWDDKKMGEHHAIIPTTLTPDFNALTPNEKKVYEVICQRFLAQFFPPTEADKAKLIIEVQSERFTASGRTVVDPGWRVIYAGSAEEEETNAKGSKDKDDSQMALPELNQGDKALCLQGQLTAKKTAPPARFTEGTLLIAMEKVHLLVSDPVMRKKLKHPSVGGIGRSATRAPIIANLLKRGFLIPQGKFVISSEIGRSLVDALPPRLIDPALTAMWEVALDQVATGKSTLDAFMNKQIDFIQKLVLTSQGQVIKGLPQGGPPSFNKGSGGKGGGKGGAGYKSSGSSSGGAKKTGTSAATKAAPAGAATCPKCKKGKLVERTIKAGPHAGKTFMGCTNYPDCK